MPHHPTQYECWAIFSRPPVADSLTAIGFHNPESGKEYELISLMESHRIAKFAVCGVGLDPWTRCAHYHGPADIVAIRMKCCGAYYACKDCHEELAGHAIEVWPPGEWNQQAVLCGACGTELTIRCYLDCGNRCPACGAGFNPGCQSHRQFYFAAEP